jgi:hypothetical protein
MQDNRGKVARRVGVFRKINADIMSWSHVWALEMGAYNSQAWKDLAPQREKAVKVIGRYAVEAMN